MNDKPIGVFDSGLGGLNVLKELMKSFPNEQYIYLGDTKRFPYGQKSKETIIKIAKENVEFLISKGCKMVIIACGTATSQALDELKERFDIPIIGVIEPTVLNIKERIGDEKKRIGIIATKGTIKSGAWENAISKNIDNIEIVSEPAPLLATMAEEGWTNNKVAEYTIKEYMKLFSNIDILILGCTHYPLFKDLMKKELQTDTEIIDVGKELESYLKKNVNQYKLDNSANTNGGFEIYLTDIEQNFLVIASKILDKDIDFNTIKIFDV